MNETEKRAWKCFRNVCNHFLGSHKADNYEEIVTELINAYKDLKCNMSLKLHYLHSHLNCFPDNLGDFSEEHGERFHQEITDMEDRYRGKDPVHMLAEYCWTLKRETGDEKYKRARTSKHF